MQIFPQIWNRFEGETVFQFLFLSTAPFVDCAGSMVALNNVAKYRTTLFAGGLEFCFFSLNTYIFFHIYLSVGHLSSVS